MAVVVDAITDFTAFLRALRVLRGSSFFPFSVVSVVKRFNNSEA
jgi:hypothetical protein